MLDINSPVQWQVKDEKYPTIKPWFTAGSLDEISKWDLKDKKVWEWGGGWSSVFWAHHCKQVYTIETNLKWIEDICEYLSSIGWRVEGRITENGLYGYVAENNDGHKLVIEHRGCNEGDQSKVDYYTEVDEDYKPDIVIIDSVLRHECLLKALTLPRPITIIHDNWKQDGFICPSSEKVMEEYEGKVFIEEAHTDNHGNKWSTAIWHIKQ